jgi:hypothetical protein
MRPGDGKRATVADPRTLTLPGHMHGGEGTGQLQRGRSVMSSMPRISLQQNNEFETTREAEALALSPRNYRLGRSQTAPSSPRDSRQQLARASSRRNAAAAAAAAAADPDAPLFQVRVLHAFEAQDKNEVSVQPGDVCDVTFDVMREHGWFEVVTSRGTHGLIPVSFCEVIASSVRNAPSYTDVDFDIDGDDEHQDAVRHYLDGTRDSLTVVAPSYSDMYGNGNNNNSNGEAGDDNDDDDDDRPPSHEPPRASPLSQTTSLDDASFATTTTTTTTAANVAELSPRSAARRQRSHVVRETLETEQVGALLDAAIAVVVAKHLFCFIDLCQ